LSSVKNCPNPQIEIAKTLKALIVLWLALKYTITHWMNNPRLTVILPYKLDTTNDLLTPRAGLIAVLN